MILKSIPIKYESSIVLENNEEDILNKAIDLLDYFKTVLRNDDIVDYECADEISKAQETLLKLVNDTLFD